MDAVILKKNKQKNKKKKSSILKFELKNLLSLTLMHSERPKLHTILAFLSAVGLMLFEFDDKR